MDKRIKKVVWTSRASKDLEKLTRFYVGLYGRTKTLKIITELRKTTEILEQKDLNTSKIGAIDETFSHLKRKYRKLLNYHCKITYREGNSNFYIVRIFDTRQDPKKNK